MNSKINDRLELPSLNDLNKNFEYDMDNGQLIWKAHRSNRAPIGSIAGTPDNGFGYTVVGLYGKCYYLHRLIWKMHTGLEPPFEIDHKDANPGNNRFSNLREANHNKNLANSNLSFANNSGIKGVSFSKSANRWRARIMVNYKDISIGYYKTIEEAITARRKYAENLHGEFAREI